MSELTDTELMLLLKYGSKQKAIHAWLSDSSSNVSKEESDIIRKFMYDSFVKVDSGIR